MSLVCGLPLLECVHYLAIARWAWKRYNHNVGHDNENWALVTIDEFELVPQIYHYILANVQ
ncbi:hypothetical protein KSP39_PZI016287 [Platanthera zijinensis]|uniref:Mono-/di-acylglycerol lipase N-terminal domain-containing protein n=1 Tax=Platanthera zijinensis TaxID=2320716 RepID=A0AAP0G0V8_9ASPA